MLKQMQKNQVKQLEVASHVTKEALKWLRDNAKNSYGPLARLTLIRPFSGAVSTWTNRSEKILQLTKTENTITKLIINVSQQHITRYKDGGLFVILLSTNVILNGLELRLPKRKVAMVTGYVFSKVTEWLCSEECCCKRKLDISSSREMMCFVKSCLCSKLTSYGVTDRELNHLASLILQGFLHVLPQQEMEHFSFSEHFNVVPVLFLPLQCSRLVTGLALHFSDRLLSKQFESGSKWLMRNDERNILTMLFDISLAGDVEGCVSEISFISDVGDISVEDVILKQLLKIFSQLVEMKVGLVGCQKVIHPLAKDYLRDKTIKLIPTTLGVLVIDRLSSQNITSVQHVCGGKTSSTLSSLPTQDSLGCLKSVETLTLQGQEYLVLEGISTMFCTLMLGCDSEQSVEEFAPMCSNIVSLLEQSVRQQYVLCGGGCCETCITHHLLQQSSTMLSESKLSELECDQKTYSAVVKSVAVAFKQVAGHLEHWGGERTVDSLYHHCWSAPPLGYHESSSIPTSCNCGVVVKSQLPSCVTWDSSISCSNSEEECSKNPPSTPLSVCDPFLAKIKAIEVTGDLASTVLQTAFVISESDS